MTIFLIFDAVDNEGTIRHKTMLNPDTIIRIDPIGTKYCRLLVQASPAQEVYVSGSLEQLQVKLNVACS